MLGLVADDLTGAGDASVQFAKRGWYTLLTLEVRPEVRLKPDTTDDPPLKVRLKPDTTDDAPLKVRLKPDTTDDAPLTVRLKPDTTGDATVMALTTDCRALGNEAAERLTSDAVTALMRAGVDRVFLKIDSTLRGSVTGQVAGALAAWQTRYPDARAVVCPAYPAMGRTVESNRLLVHGEPVERTVFGRDPVTPVTTSDMAALIPLSPRVSVPDAATNADLMTIAASISAAGPSVIAVGSGGLADALAATWCAPSTHALAAADIMPKRQTPRILLQVSSMNPVSHAQVARLKSTFPEVVVLLAPLERGDSKAVIERLAREFVQHVEREPWDILGLIGGDGARETLARLGASGIRIVDSLLEGIPLGLVVDGRADGTPVFTKAGGFGAEDALVRVFERMTA
ncbi:MAG TPA: four-carbon acid sugar kinase family protein [Vicinamibacterales bacterium]